MSSPGLDDFIDSYHRALDEFFRGNSEPAKGLYSHREDVTLGNPFGPVAIGWQRVKEAMERSRELHGRWGPPASTPSQPVSRPASRTSSKSSNLRRRWAVSRVRQARCA
jgi:hypothetical protein